MGGPRPVGTRWPAFRVGSPLLPSAPAVQGADRHPLPHPGPLAKPAAQQPSTAFSMLSSPALASHRLPDDIASPFTCDFFSSLLDVLVLRRKLVQTQCGRSSARCRHMPIPSSRSGSPPGWQTGLRAVPAAGVDFSPAPSWGFLRAANSGNSIQAFCFPLEKIELNLCYSIIGALSVTCYSRPRTEIGLTIGNGLINIWKRNNGQRTLLRMGMRQYFSLTPVYQFNVSDFLNHFIEA